MNTPDNAYLKSSFYEQLVEHVFIAEVLQETWYSFEKTVEVLRSEVDAFGYDLVFECNGIIRHVQLKASKHDGKTAVQKVNVALAEKPCGCVVWVFREEEEESTRMKLTYRYFGGKAGKPLPPLDCFKVAKHTKWNSGGIQSERKAIRVVPKREFKEVENIRALVRIFFGLKSP